MDPALLKERELFKRRAMSQPTIEKRKAPPTNDKSAKKSRPLPKPRDEVSAFDYKKTAGSSKYKFGVLAKIVKYMKERHIVKRETHSLTLSEILDETKQLDVPVGTKVWLEQEALPNNPKISVVEGDKFIFKPKFNIRNSKGLLRLLDKYDQKGLGGILLDDIEESLPKCDLALKNIKDHVVQVQRPHDKKIVLFYNDKSLQFTIEEEFQKLWRGVSVEIDEQKIDEYLLKNGITSMQDVGARKVAPIQKRKRTGNRKNKVINKHNEHLGDLLVDYSQMNETK